MISGTRCSAYSKALGVGWIKVQIEWKELEPDKGNYNNLYAAMVLRMFSGRSWRGSRP